MITQEEDMEVHALKKQGWSLSAIARHTGLDRKTVRAYLNGEREVGVRKRSEGDVDPFDRIEISVTAGIGEDAALSVRDELPEVAPVRRTGWLCSESVAVTVEVIFDLAWRVVLVPGVESVWVVPAFDPADQIAACVGSGCPSAAVGEFAFEGPEKRFGYCVVPAHPGRSHRPGHAVAGTESGELVGGVLAGSVGMKDHAVDVTATGRHCHLQRVHHQLSTHVFSYSPADHAP